MGIAIGPISGLYGLAVELMLELGHDPDDLPPGFMTDLEEALAEETLEIGLQFLAEHGLERGEAVGYAPQDPPPRVEDRRPSEYALWRQSQAASGRPDKS